MGVYLLCAELAPLLAKARKLWKQSALSRGEEVSSIHFPELRKESHLHNLWSESWADMLLDDWK